MRFPQIGDAVYVPVWAEAWLLYTKLVTNFDTKRMTVILEDGSEEPIKAICYSTYEGDARIAWLNQRECK